MDQGLQNFLDSIDFNSDSWFLGTLFGVHMSGYSNEKIPAGHLFLIGVDNKMGFSVPVAIECTDFSASSAAKALYEMKGEGITPVEYRLLLDRENVKQLITTYNSFTKTEAEFEQEIYERLKDLKKTEGSILSFIRKFLK